jgi:hypothetical protein
VGAPEDEDQVRIRCACQFHITEFRL